MMCAYTSVAKIQTWNTQQVELFPKLLRQALAVLALEDDNSTDATSKHAQLAMSAGLFKLLYEWPLKLFCC